MRAVVIGGSGQIGGWLLHWLRERGHEAIGTYQTVAYPDLIQLDMAEAEQATEWLRRQSPDVVFYPAGFTWVDGCERDPKLARAANFEQPLMMARAASNVGARFVSFSTDYVFNGHSGPYAEDSPTDPISVYGSVKLEAERALAEELGPGQLTIRTCWVYGPERQGKNFAYQVVKALADGRDLVCPIEMKGSPSYGPDVALTSVRLAEAGASGLIHVAGPEFVGRLEFAAAIARSFGLDHGRLVAMPYHETGAKAARPLLGGLRTPLLDAMMPNALRPLETALIDFRDRVAGAGPWTRPQGAQGPT